MPNVWNVHCLFCKVGCTAEILSGWIVPLGHSPWIAPPSLLGLAHDHVRVTSICTHKARRVHSGWWWRCRSLLWILLSSRQRYIWRFCTLKSHNVNLEFQNRAKIDVIPNDFKWRGYGLCKRGKGMGGWNWRQMVSIASPGSKHFCTLTGENLKSNG